MAWFDEYREKAAEYPAMAYVGGCLRPQFVMFWMSGLLGEGEAW